MFTRCFLRKCKLILGHSVRYDGNDDDKQCVTFQSTCVELEVPRTVRRVHPNSSVLAQTIKLFQVPGL